MKLEQAAIRLRRLLCIMCGGHIWVQESNSIGDKAFFRCKVCHILRLRGIEE